MPNIEAIQKTLAEQNLDGWLFYDILHRDPIAYRVLELDHGFTLFQRRVRPENLCIASRRGRSIRCPVKNWFTRRPKSWKRT
jgi:hypothetical protein